MANDRRLASISILLAISVTTAAPVHAQTAPPAQPPAAPPPSGDPGRADALFQEGKRLLEQGKTEAACKLLAESDAADPAVSTVGLLAACHEQQGRLATAWKEYRETVRRAAAANDARGEFARQRAAALEPRLPKLVVRLARPDPDIEILRDGAPVPAADLGVEVPVDPGTYTIVARAKDRQAYRAIVAAKEGVVTAVDVPELSALAPPPPPLPRVVIAPPPPQSDAPIPGAVARRSAGLVLGGVGLAGLGVGVGFGVSALELNRRSQTSYDTCKAPGASAEACASGRALRSSAFTSATASTVGFGIAAAGLASGIVLLVWPSHRAPTPARTGLEVAPLVGPGAGGAALGGAF